MRLHIGVDSQSGLAHSAVVAPANVHDKHPLPQLLHGHPRTRILPTLLQGVPTALFFVPLTAIILSGLPADRIPPAAGLSNFVRVFAGGVGSSLATTGWNNRTILHRAQLAEQSSANNPDYANALANIRGARWQPGSGHGILRAFTQCASRDAWIRPVVRSNRAFLAPRCAGSRSAHARCASAVQTRAQRLCETACLARIGNVREP
jgi:Transposase DDE domain